MVLYVCVDPQYAQLAKDEITKSNNLLTDYPIIRQTKIIKFPVSPTYSGKFPTEDLSIDPIKSKVVTSFKDRLKEFLPDESTIRSFDQLGTIAIIEIPSEIIEHQVRIANCLLQSNKLVKTVLKKSDRHDGVFRTQKMEYLAGIETKIAMFGENSCRFILDVEQVYFSIRQSTERNRIAKLVQPDELVLVMFSGAAPFPCILGRHTQAKHIDAVELNPVGHHYAIENIKLNRLETRVSPHYGDARVVVPTFKQKYDRIIMPLPKTSEEFLDVAIASSKIGTIIHLYTFAAAKEFVQTSDKIAKLCEEYNHEYKLLQIVKNGQHSPGVYRICIDFQLGKKKEPLS